MRSEAGLLERVVSLVLFLAAVAAASGDVPAPRPREAPPLYVGHPDGKEWAEMVEGRRVLLDEFSYPRLPAKLVSGPTATRSGAEIRIGFGLDRHDDVRVRVVDGQGRVVRNLGCGVLGPNAPPPFKPDSLSQMLIWDLKDNEGRGVSPEGCRVQIDVGLTPRLERFAASDPFRVPRFVSGIEVDPQGRVYVGSVSPPELLRYDREGRYLDSPYYMNPNFLDPDKLPRFLQYGWDRVDGKPVPQRKGWVPRTLIWPFAGRQRAAFPLRIARDGTAWLDAYDKDISPHQKTMKVLPVALDPMLRGETPPRGYYGIALLYDCTWAMDAVGHAYFARSTYMKDHGHVTPVIRKVSATTGEPVADFAYNGTQELPEKRHYLGTEKEPGEDEQHFIKIRDLEIGPGGRVFVADTTGLKVYEPDGRFVAKIETCRLDGQDYELAWPVGVRVTADAFYVLNREGRKKAGQSEIGASAAVVKFTGDPAAPKAVWRAPVHGLARSMAVDAARRPAIVWVGNGNGPATFTRIADEGDKPGEVRHIGKGIGPGTWLSLNAIGVDAQGRLFVHDDGRGKLVRTNDDASEWKETYATITAMYIDRPRGWIYTTAGRARRCDRRDLDLDQDKSFKLEREGSWTLGGVDSEGNIYTRVGNRVDQFGPDGTSIKEGVCELFMPDGAFAMDRHGAFYVMDSAFPREPECELIRSQGTSHGKDWPSAAHNKVFEIYHNLGRFTAWKGRRDGWVLKRGDRMYRNQSEGASLVKFPPGGGKRATETEEWAHVGVSPVTMGGCSCSGYSSINCVAVDESDRVFVTDIVKYHVKALDSAGNLIARVGAYGNRDCVGPQGKFPQPEIGFMWPNSVAVLGDSLYVSDRTLLRIAKIRLDYREKKEAPLP